MTRTMRLYKRLLDMSLLVSYFLLVLLVFLLIFSVSVGALHFDSSDAPLIDEQYRYLRPILITNVAGIIIFMVLARVFLQFIINSEKVESVDKYREKQVRKEASQRSRSRKKDKQLELQLRKQELLLEVEEQLEKEEHVSASEAIIAEQKGIKISKLQPKEEPLVVDNSDEIDDVDEELEEDLEVSSTIDSNTEESKEPVKKYYTRLTKGDLNSIIAQVINTSEYKARKFVNSFLKIIEEELQSGNQVKIEEFGRFYTSTIKEHQGVNPATKEPITIEQHRVAKFTPYKAFRELITNDVVATGNRYLFGREATIEMNEDQVAEKLQKEHIAEEHIEDKIIKPAVKKRKAKTIKKTKKDIIEYMEKKTNLSKNKSNKFLFAMTDVFAEVLGRKEDIILDDFGKFTTIHMPEKVAVNPQTNEMITVEEHYQVRMRFDDSFKDKFTK